MLHSAWKKHWKPYGMPASHLFHLYLLFTCIVHVFAVTFRLQNAKNMHECFFSLGAHRTDILCGPPAWPVQICLYSPCRQLVSTRNGSCDEGCTDCASYKDARGFSFQSLYLTLNGVQNQAFIAAHYSSLNFRTRTINDIFVLCFRAHCGSAFSV